MTWWVTAWQVDWRIDWCCVFVAEQQNNRKQFGWCECLSTGLSQDGYPDFKQTERAEQGPSAPTMVHPGSDATDEATHITERLPLSCWAASRLDRIHSPTSAIRADTQLWSCAVSHGRHEPNICVSSAYRCGRNPCVSTKLIRSAVYSRKRICPKTDPCRSPNRTAFGSDDVDPQETVLGPQLFHLYIKDTALHIESDICLLADDCILYWKVKSSSDWSFKEAVRRHWQTVCWSVT